MISAAIKALLLLLYFLMTKIKFLEDIPKTRGKEKMMETKQEEALYFLFKMIIL